MRPSTARRPSKMTAPTIAVGKKAPEIVLKNQHDDTVKLSEFEDQWVVLYFYPKDDTPGCTVEACDFTSGLKSFEKLNATVLGCTPAATHTHPRFIAKHKLTISLLSDPEHKLMDDYGAWGEKNSYGRV